MNKTNSEELINQGDWRGSRAVYSDKPPLTFKADEDTALIDSSEKPLEQLTETRLQRQQAVAKIDFESFESRIKLLDSQRSADVDRAELESSAQLLENYHQSLSLLSDSLIQEFDATKGARLGTIDSNNDAALEGLESMRKDLQEKISKLRYVEERFGKSLLAYKVANRFWREKPEEIIEQLRESARAAYSRFNSTRVESYFQQADSFTYLEVEMENAKLKADDPNYLADFRRAVLRFIKKMTTDKIKSILEIETTES